jgi:hypothetical protein
MTWGSASADRSIIASEPLPRTPVPRPTGQGLPATGTRQTAPLGALGARSHRGREPDLLGGPAPHSTGARQPELFGAPRAEPHRGQATGALRSIVRRASPGQGTASSSEPTAPHLTGTGKPHLLGGAAPPSHPGQSPPPTGAGHPAHRGQADGTPRGAASRTPPGQSKRSSSERRAPSSTGAGNRTSSEGRPPTSPGQSKRSSSERRAPSSTGTGNRQLFGADGPPPRRDREPDLLGGTAPHLTPGQDRPASPGPGNRSSSEPRALSSTGMGPPPLWGRANGALRSTARPASPGPGKRSSSEPRAPGSTGTGNRKLFGADGPPPRRDREPDLLGGPAPHPASGQGPPPHGARQTALLGAPRAAPHRANATGAPRSAGRRDPPG